MTQTFSKTEKQRLAIKLQASAINSMLYGGSRSGKTFITLRSIFIRAARVKSRHLVGRLRFNHAKTSIWHDTFPKMHSLCFPNVPVTENKSDWFWSLPNGSQIWLGGLDDKERLEKVLGNEYSTVYLNECSQLGFSAVEMMQTRLAEKTDLVNRMFFDCNPPSKKHWVYKLFELLQNPDDGTPLRFPDDFASMIMNPSDNAANLPDGYIERTLGGMSKRKRDRFELGLFASDVEGALWIYETIMQAKAGLSEREAKKTVVGVDPAVTSNANSDLTGIVVASELENDFEVDERTGADIRRYRVNADYSGRMTPREWANAVKFAYYEHDANEVIAEVNQGGDLVKENISICDGSIPVRMVRASKGKYARAEPIAHLYEKGEVEHDEGLDELEEEMLDYVPKLSKKSPDRLDAVVWALTGLSHNVEILISV